MERMDIRMAAARYRLAQTHPYLAAGLFALQFREKEGLGTLKVDRRWRVYYDPELQWDVQFLGWVLYHELLHLLRRHAERGEAISADPLAWNVAADMEINDDLVSEGMPMEFPDEPDSRILHPRNMGLQTGRLAEEYLEDLARKGWTGGDGKTSSASGQSGARSSGNPAGRPDVLEGSCGSCATGQPEDYEDGDEGGGGVSEKRADLIRRQVAQAIREHARSRGRVPGALERWAGLELEPLVDWRQEFAALLKVAISWMAGMEDYTFSRPSRRQDWSADVLLPSLVARQIHPAIVLDVSGSISPEDLEMELAEVVGILRASGIHEATLLEVDARVQRSRRVRLAELSGSIEVTGGGGTDMRVGIEEAMAARPDVVVVLTDGYTPWPESAPRVPVIAALVEDVEVPEWVRKVLLN